METLDLFPANMAQSQTQILLLNTLPEAQPLLLQLLQEMRTLGISCEFYPDVKKLDKQMKYANKRRIPFVGIMAESEDQVHK